MGKGREGTAGTGTAAGREAQARGEEERKGGGKPAGGGARVARLAGRSRRARQSSLKRVVRRYLCDTARIGLAGSAAGRPAAVVCV